MATVEGRVPYSTAAITVAACAAAAVAGTEAREPRCWDRPQHCERELSRRESSSSGSRRSFVGGVAMPGLTLGSPQMSRQDSMERSEESPAEQDVIIGQRNSTSAWLVAAPSSSSSSPPPMVVNLSDLKAKGEDPRDLLRRI